VTIIIFLSLFSIRSFIQIYKLCKTHNFFLIWLKDYVIFIANDKIILICFYNLSHNWVSFIFFLYENVRTKICFSSMRIYCRWIKRKKMETKRIRWYYLNTCTRIERDYQMKKEPYSCIMCAYLRSLLNIFSAMDEFANRV
jgi:hypothetical protein